MPGGQNTNASGLPFEKQIRKLFFERDMKNGDEYVIHGKKFNFYVKRSLHKRLIENGMYDSNYDHCKEPDIALLDEKLETLFVFEIKHQAYNGSCDNKIRGGLSLLREYKELYPKLKNVHLAYIMNRGQESPGTYAYGFGVRKLRIPIRHNQEDGIPSFFADRADNRYRLIKIKRKSKDDLWLPIPYLYKIDVKSIEDWIGSKLQV